MASESFKRRNPHLHGGVIPQNAYFMGEPVAPGEEIEKLHGPILKWLKDNKVPHYHARPDQESGLTKGAPDFAVFLPGKTILIECKTVEGKLSVDQLAWKMMAEQNGFTVHVVRSMDEFYALVL